LVTFVEPGKIATELCREICGRVFEFGCATVRGALEIEQAVSAIVAQMKVKLAFVSRNVSKLVSSRKLPNQIANSSAG
jgi:hypothetical protein